MPSYGGGDTLRQTIDILLRTAGTDDVARIKDLIVDLTAQQYLQAEASRAQGESADAVAAALRASSSDIANLTKLYLGLEQAERAAGEATVEWAALQAKLGQMEQQSAEGARQEAQAVKDGTQAVRERMQAIVEGEQRAGDAKRARIDALARAERAAESEAKATMKAAQQIVEADEAIARAEAMAAMAAEEATKKRDAEAGRVAFFTNQVHSLDAALMDMHAHEIGATRATTAEMMSEGAVRRERIESIAEAERGTRQWADSMARLGERVNSGLNPMDEHNRRVGAMSRGFLELSRGIEDFAVAGPLGILNNIPNIVYNIGVATGATAAQVTTFTAAISLGGTAAYLLYQNWDKVMGGLGLGKIQAEAEAMEELGKKTHKTAVETERLNAAKKVETSAKAMFEGLSDEQAEQKKIVEEAMKGPGAFKIRDALVENSQELLEFTSRDAGAASRAARKREEELKNVSTPFGGFRARTPEEYTAALQTDPTLQKLKAEQFDQLQKAAAALMGSAATTPGNLDFLIAAVGDKKNKGKFPAGLLPTLESATDTGQKRSAAIDLAAEMREGDDEAFMERRKVARELKAQKERRDKAQAVQEGKDARENAAKEREVEAAEDKAAAFVNRLDIEARRKREKAAKGAQKAAADDVRDSIRDIGISGDDAGGKQQSLQGVAARIRQQAATLGEEMVGDLMRQARAAFQAAGRQGDAELKKELAEEAKAIRAGQPTAVLHRAAAPFIQQAVAAGVPHGEAQHAITGQMQNVLAMGGNLQQATLSVMQQMPAFLMHHQQQIQAMQMQLGAIQGQMNGVRAGVRGNRGGGLPTLQPTVRPGP